MIARRRVESKCSRKPSIERSFFPKTLTDFQRPSRNSSNRLAVGDILIAGDYGIGPHDGAAPSGYRRDQDRAGADPAADADVRLTLDLAVEIRRDRSRANVCPFSDDGVAQVGQMPRDRPLSQLRIFDLDKRAQFHIVFEY